MKSALIFCFLLFPLALSAADQSAEYEQVRRIAMRDPGVRSAFAAADRKLEERILKIDPTLKAYVGAQKRPATAKKQPNTNLSERPARKPVAVQPAGNKGGKYTVVKGDTLTAIAAAHGTTLASLKAANSMTDRSKLAAGQVLVLPAGTKKPAAPPASPGKPKAQEKSWWQSLFPNRQ